MDPIGKFSLPTGTKLPSQPSDFGKFATTVVSLLVAVAGIWFLLQLLIGGITYISGAGDAKKTEASMKKITDSVIGIVIIGAAFIITNILSNLIFGPGTSILSPQLTPLQ